MIISKDINPEKDFYYLGAKVIEILSNQEEDKMDFLSVFEELQALDKISVNLYSLTLDWLFLLEVIDYPVNGKIKVCF